MQKHLEVVLRTSIFAPAFREKHLRKMTNLKARKEVKHWRKGGFYRE